jgi:hypothetical protein
MSKHILTRLLCTIALLSIVNAAEDDEHHIHKRSPDLPNGKGNFIVERFRKPDHIRNGILAKQKVFSKYKKLEGAAPSLIGKRSQDGRVTAVPQEYYSEYICNVTIGGQLMGMDLGMPGCISRSLL